MPDGRCGEFKREAKIMQSVAALLARKNTKLSAREVKGKQSRTKDTS